MKISYNWLLKYIDTNLGPKEIGDKLTSIGLEVEDIEFYTTSPKGMADLVVGYVAECIKHPNADTLKLTKVDVGGPELLNIVCGAPNVEAGQKVIVAKEGVMIHPFKGESFQIKRSKIRGEFSEGMLCAEDEIGLGESHAGLLILDSAAEIGAPVSRYIGGYEDWIIEIGLTPNRVDAASHIGVARDLAALLGTRVKYPETKTAISEEIDSPVEIVINDAEACPRYSGLVIKGLEVKDSPDWLRDALKAIGLNPVNNVVDATNYVLHEYGHPLHAFDLSKIEGNKILIQKSKDGDKFHTLDKQERSLNGTELMICNAKAPMAIAGVMGGLDSSITTSTKDIFIESAYFDPSGIRRAARRHQLFTDASFRFERGADPNITLTVLNRVASLIQDIAGGSIIGPVYDQYPKPIPPVQLRFDFAYLDAVAGASIPQKEVENILSGLEFKFLESDEKGFLIEIPTFKSDIKRPIDIVEEVIRIYSFDKINMPAQLKSIVQVDKYEHAEKLRKRISAFLIDQGFYEAILMTFVKESDNKYFEDRISIPLMNPLSSDLGFVRNNLLLPGLKVLEHNLNRQQTKVKIFTWGQIHSGDPENIKQESRLNLWVSGNLQDDNWIQKPAKADYFYLKGIVERIMELADRNDFEVLDYHDTMIEYGTSYIGNNQKAMARYGKLDNRFLKKNDIGQEVFYADIDSKWLLKEHGLPLKYDPISKFPRVERDLALSVPVLLNYSDIRKLIMKTENKILKKISIFDVYKGGQVGEGLKSYAIRLEFEDKSQTLEDKVIDKIMSKIIYRLENELQVKIRS